MYLRPFQKLPYGLLPWPLDFGAPVHIQQPFFFCTLLQNLSIARLRLARGREQRERDTNFGPEVEADRSAPANVL